VDLSELAEERWAAGLPAAPTVGRPGWNRSRWWRAA